MSITLILGGARSGKSRYAQQLAASNNVAYVATCSYDDAEMQERIVLHKQDRPKMWETIEEFEDLAGLIERIGSKFDYIIIDCLTLFISCLLLKDVVQTDIQNRIRMLIKQAQFASAEVIMVSNEVGLGLVPDTEIGRTFRDLSGRVHQMIAADANQVVFMMSGIPMKLKEKEKQ